MYRFNLIGYLVIACTLICVPIQSALAQQTLRVATFNTSMFRTSEGELLSDLSDADSPPGDPADLFVKIVAETIQRINPDILLINEIDFDPNGTAATFFNDNFLSQSQNFASTPSPPDPVNYPYRFVAESNTGIDSGFDFNNNGSTGDPEDAYGFGNYYGQFGMALFSKYPIAYNDVRTFQQFLWKDMPGALLPDDGGTPEPDDWYSDEELDVFRLSSKSHWDVPIDVNGQTIHVLASHPTPPVFDGAEDRNGRRNHDEIRLWADYVDSDPTNSSYIYDDSNVFGGLGTGESFVVMGDQNADPDEGDSVAGAIQQLLNSPEVNQDINTTFLPTSSGAPDDPDDTATFNLRVDYVLPSADLDILDSGVFWPSGSDPLGILNAASDHRLVWVDVAVVPEPSSLVLITGLVSLCGLLRR